MGAAGSEAGRGPRPGDGEAEARIPYRSNEDLPPAVRNHLPEHACDIYRAAFNAAYAAHMDDPRQEEAAHRITWAAVKRVYEKVGVQWVPIAR